MTALDAIKTFTAWLATGTKGVAGLVIAVAVAIRALPGAERDEHRRTRVRSPKKNGFVERLNVTVLEEFFQAAMREAFYRDVDSLQADLDAWLNRYNRERPHLGYRNQGRRPWETVRQFTGIMSSKAR